MISDKATVRYHKQVKGLVIWTDKEKRCNGCKGMLPHDRFSPVVRSIDGLSYKCKICDAKQKRDKRHGVAKEAPKGSSSVRYHKFIPDTIIWTDTHKRCNVCEELLPHKEFSKKAEIKDGLDKMCRLCAGKYNRGMSPKYKERISEYSKTYKRPVVSIERKNLLRHSHRIARADLKGVFRYDDHGRVVSVVKECETCRRCIVARSTQTRYCNSCAVKERKKNSIRANLKRNGRMGGVIPDTLVEGLYLVSAINKIIKK